MEYLTPETTSRGDESDKNAPIGCGFSTSFNTMEISSHLFEVEGEKELLDRLLSSYKAKVFRCKHEFIYLKCVECSRIHARPKWCRDRFCPDCAPRLGEWSKKLIDIILKERGLEGKKNKLKFLTLTCENFPLERLREGLDILNKAFARLVRRKNKVDKRTGRVERQGWRDTFVGWIKRYEVTKGQDGNYHLHIHVLAEGKYLPQAQLADVWQDCLAKEGWDGRVCDIRAVKGLGGAIKEIVKYCFKPLEMSELDLAILSKAFKNRRLYSFGGVWYSAFKGLSKKDLIGIYEDMKGIVDSMVFICVCDSKSFSVQIDMKGVITKKFLSEMASKWKPYLGGYVFDTS